MSMSKDVTADLAKESKREAAGVDWDRYQAVCDELESIQAELEDLVSKLPRFKADAIREAAEACAYHGDTIHSDLIIYADKIEAGTL